MSAISVPVALFYTGIVSHILYFRRGEHHMQVNFYVCGYFLVIVITAFLIHENLVEQRWSQAFRAASKLSLFYLSGVYLSLSTYRLFFHPLRHFPGPFGARISAFWLSWRIRKSDAYLQLQALHDHYGPFVRVGPSDLSIAHPKSVPLVYGSGSECSKAQYYDLTRPVVSLQTFRDKREHDARRRVWSTAFGLNSVKGYETRLKPYQDKLLKRFEESEGRPVNVTEWFKFYNFDIMGELAFGKPFDMLDSSKQHWAVQVLDDGVKVLAFMLPMWFFRLATSIPGLARDFMRLLAFSRGRVVQRMKETPPIPDIMSTLLAPLKDRQPTKSEMDLLVGDAQLIIAAGSDTTSTTLTAVFYLLAKHPKEIDRLREELAPYVDVSNEVMSENISHLDHLNGVINEALRLYPPVPSAIYRKTPTQGITIDGIYIPGDMTVYCLQYTLGRSADVYSEPNSFVPERWYRNPEMIKEKSAFSPFLTGPYGCIGKPLALMNLRTTISRIILDFDISFAPGDDGSSFVNMAKENFLYVPGKLNLVFKSRT